MWAKLPKYQVRKLTKLENQFIDFGLASGLLLLQVKPQARRNPRANKKHRAEVENRGGEAGFGLSFTQTHTHTPTYTDWLRNRDKAKVKSQRKPKSNRNPHIGLLLIILGCALSRALTRSLTACSCRPVIVILIRPFAHSQGAIPSCRKRVVLCYIVCGLN